MTDVTVVSFYEETPDEYLEKEFHCFFCLSKNNKLFWKLFFKNV